MKETRDGYKFEDGQLPEIVGDIVFMEMPDEKAFMVGSKIYFEKNKCFFDRQIEDGFMPDGFTQEAEGMFMYKIDWEDEDQNAKNFAEGKQKLLDAGFKEVFWGN